MILPLLLAPETLALTGATVHTLEPGSTPAVMTVLVENDRIVDVGPDVAVPADARRVDLTGLHLVPGLVDGMVNHDPDHDRLYVGAGVTLVRDVGNDLTRIQAEQQRGARDRSPGPWIWSAGAVLDGYPPATTSAIVMASAAEAEDKLKRLLGLDLPPDYFVVQPGLPRESWSKALELAHKGHKQVWGPLPRGVTLAEALDAGQDGLFHLDTLLPPGRAWDKVTPEELAPSVEAVMAKHAAVTPTLALWGRALVAPKEDAPELLLLGPYYVQTWLDDAKLRRSIATREHLAQGLAVLDAQSRLLKTLHERGARLVPGSAAPNAWLFPGQALLDELLLWHRAGIPAPDCLRAATAGACEALGTTLRGTIRKSKIADLIATAGDPEQDLAALRKPAYVVLRGRVLDRRELDLLEQDLAQRQKKIREDFAKPLAVAEPALPDGDVVLRGFVETRAIGVRVSAERFAVVRRYDGALVYCGRVLTPGEATVPDTETSVQQVIAGGDLTAFTVEMRTGARNVTVQGELAGGVMNVSRRFDGSFVDNVPIRDKLALVDCGSVTAWLILGYHRKPGVFQVAFFDDYEPAVGRWEMALDKDGRTHLLRTPMGQAVVVVDERGMPVDARRAQGNSLAQTKLLDGRVEDGRGLPMPADKKALAGTGPARPKPADAPQPAGAGKEPPK